MRKFLVSIISLITGLIFTFTVEAQESIFYTNNQNVNFTEKEYNFVTNLFYDGFQEIMDVNDYYKIFKDQDFINNPTVSKTYEEKSAIQPYSNNHETGSKILTIKRNCSSDCMITITVQWKVMPKIRSYDVIGTRFKNVNRLDTATTKVKLDSTFNSSSTTDYKDNGFGASIKLPTGGNSLIITQFFKVTKGGTVYGSYQHATRTISLANSRNYSISSNGLGGVFSFNDGYNSYYDAMGGVDITV